MVATYATLYILLEDLAGATSMVDVNIAAGMAMQRLELIVPRPPLGVDEAPTESLPAA